MATTQINGREIPSSLASALVALCKLTYDIDLPDDQFHPAARNIHAAHRPVRIDGRPMCLENFLMWYDGLSADEFYRLAGAPRLERPTGRKS